MADFRIPDDIERWEKKGLREDIDTDAEHVHEFYVWKNLAIEHEVFKDCDCKGHWNPYAIVDGHPLKLSRDFFDSFDEAVGYLKACMKDKEITDEKADGSDCDIPKHPEGDTVTRKSVSMATRIAMMNGEPGAMERYKAEMRELRKAEDSVYLENLKQQDQIDKMREGKHKRGEINLLSKEESGESPSETQGKKVNKKGKTKDASSTGNHLPDTESKYPDMNDITGGVTHPPAKGKEWNLEDYLDDLGDDPLNDARYAYHGPGGANLPDGKALEVKGENKQPHATNITAGGAKEFPQTNMQVRGRGLNTYPPSKFMQNSFQKLLPKMVASYNSKLDGIGVHALPENIGDMSVRQLRSLLMNEYQFKDPVTGQLTYYNGQEGRGVPILGGVQYAQKNADGTFRRPYTDDGRINPGAFTMLASEAQSPKTPLYRNEQGLFNPLFGGMRQNNPMKDTTAEDLAAVGAKDEALDRWRENVFAPYAEQNPDSPVPDTEFERYARELALADDSVEDQSVEYLRRLRNATDEGRAAYKRYKNLARLAEPKVKSTKDNKEAVKQDREERKAAEEANKTPLEDTDNWYLDSEQRVPPLDMVLNALSYVGRRAHDDGGFKSEDISDRVSRKFGEYDENGKRIPGTGDLSMSDEDLAAILEPYRYNSSGLKAFNDTGAKTRWATDQLKKERLDRLIGKVEPLMMHYMDNMPISEILALFEKYPGLRRNTALSDADRAKYYQNLFDNKGIRDIWNGEGNPLKEWNQYVFQGHEFEPRAGPSVIEQRQDAERESGIHGNNKQFVPENKNTSKVQGGMSREDSQNAMGAIQNLHKIVYGEGRIPMVDTDKHEEDNLRMNRISESMRDRIAYFDPMFVSSTNKSEDAEVPSGRADTNPRIAAFRTVSMGEGKDSSFPMKIVDKTTGKVLVEWDGRL